MKSSKFLLLDLILKTCVIYIDFYKKKSNKLKIQLKTYSISQDNKSKYLSNDHYTETKDLFNIRSKGFRGEALSSIAAVSHLEIITKRRADNFGYKLKIKAGKVHSNEKVVSEVGTSVLVKNLFYNVPARRNFLKSDSVELRHIINEFQRISIAHCDLNISLNHNKSC